MIRRAEEGDAPALAELMTQLGYPTRADEMRLRLRELLPAKTFATFVAVESLEVIGVIGLSISHSYEHNERTGKIVALAVDERWRRKGVGRKLIAAAEDYFASERVGRIAVTSHFRRSEAHEFYESLGYERTGFRFIKQLPAR